MTIPNSKDFMMRKFLNDDTMNEIDLKKVNNFPIYPTDSKFSTTKIFVNKANGVQGGIHWTLFYRKDNNFLLSFTWWSSL